MLLTSFAFKDFFSNNTYFTFLGQWGKAELFHLAELRPQVAVDEMKEHLPCRLKH